MLFQLPIVSSMSSIFTVWLIGILLSPVPCGYILFCFMNLNIIFVMVTILFSSDSAPLSYVMICWNTIMTILNKSFRDELFTLGVWTDWHVDGCASFLFLPLWQGRPGTLRAAEVAAVAVLLCSAATKQSRGGVVGRDSTSCCSLGLSLQPSLYNLVLSIAAASVVGGLRFVSAHQLAVAACRYQWCIAPFWELSVFVATPTPHRMGRLLTVSPDIAEFLADVTLHEPCLGFVSLYPDCNMTQDHQFEYLIWLGCPV
jgi:hypothetical protein